MAGGYPRRRLAKPKSDILGGVERSSFTGHSPARFARASFGYHSRMADDDLRAGDSTLDDVSEATRPPHGLWVRRAAVVLMVLVLCVAGSGWLGVHSQTRVASAGGDRLTVTFARVARAGLDVPMTIHFHAAQPISGDIVIGIAAAYFRMFETQGFFPEPSDMTSDETTVYLTFAPPPTGRDLVVDYDAYIQPANQQGARTDVTVYVNGVRRLAVPIGTTLFP